MSYTAKDVTKEEINLWKKNKLINPRTNRKIKVNSKIYKYLEEMNTALNKKPLKKSKKSKKSKKDLDDQILDETLEQILDETIEQSLELVKDNSFTQTDENNSDMFTRINELENIIKERDSTILSFKNSINDIENSNKNLQKELEDKNKLLEENNKKIEELKDDLKKYETSQKKELEDKSCQIDIIGDIPSPNNLILVVPFAILCIGWVIKNSVFGISY